MALQTREDVDDSLNLCQGPSTVETLLPTQQIQTIAAYVAKPYQEWKTDVETKVIQWTSFGYEAHSYEPMHFEIDRVAVMQRLAKHIDPAELDHHHYGYDALGRMIVERETKGLTKWYGESFFIHLPEGILQICFGGAGVYKEQDPLGTCDVAYWFATESDRVVAKYTFFKGKFVHVDTYEYDERNRMVRKQGFALIDGVKTLRQEVQLEYDNRGRLNRIEREYAGGDRILEFQRVTPKTTLKALMPKLLEGFTVAAIQAIRAAKIRREVYVLVVQYNDNADDRVLPPILRLNTVADRKRLWKEMGEPAAEAMWDPAEWESGLELELTLSPELAALCVAANQDIWQNDRYQAAATLHVLLARNLEKADLALRRSDDFVCVAMNVEAGEFGAQMKPQIRADRRKLLQQRGYWPSI